MKISIRFHQVKQSKEVFAMVDSEARKLCQFYPEIISCVVSIEKPSHRRRKGNPVRAQVTISLPGKSMVFAKKANGQGESECALAALSSAFDAVEKTVSEYTNKRREAEERQFRSLLDAAFVPVN